MNPAKMNPRIYKKWCKRAIELLKSYETEDKNQYYPQEANLSELFGERLSDQIVKRLTKQPHKIRQWETMRPPLKYVGNTQSETDEYDSPCFLNPIDSWIWLILDKHLLSPKDWYEIAPYLTPDEIDKLDASESEKAEWIQEFIDSRDKVIVKPLPPLHTLISTRMIGPGYRWRGGKSVPERISK